MRRLLFLPVLVLGLAAGSAFGASQKAADAGTVGKIRALNPTSISVDGKRDHDLTCKLTDGSPKTAGFDVGDRVAVVCKDGVLRRIVRLPGGTTAVGAIKLLNQHAIGVDADHDMTCRLTDDSPDTDGFAVGDSVAIACADGALVKIVRVPAVATQPAVADTSDGDAGKSTSGHNGSTQNGSGNDGGRKDATTTTSTPAPTSVTVTGAISALGQGSITIDAEHDLTCKLTGDSPIPGQFKVGDRVKLVCTNGVVSSIAKLDTPPPPPPPPPPRRPRRPQPRRRR